MRRVVLLGPQRLSPIIGRVAVEEGLVGPVAVVTAGWQEREPEDQELVAALGLPAINLELYARGEDVRERDPEYAAAHRARQDQLRELQELYRFRLGFQMQAAAELLGRSGRAALLDPEREAALLSIQELDLHHLARVADVNLRFEAALKPAERPALRAHRNEVAAILEDCGAVAIAGGHIAVLLNRLRLFGVARNLRHKAVLAWSAGAMALTDRVVLFHDFPPEGAGFAEVLDRGERLVPAVAVLPHARHRMDHTNPIRMQLLARRFPATRVCALDENQYLTWDGNTLSCHGGARIVHSDGRLEAQP